MSCSVPVDIQGVKGTRVHYRLLCAYSHTGSEGDSIALQAALCL